MQGLLALGGGLCFLLVWFGFTWRPQAQASGSRETDTRPGQYRLRELRGIGSSFAGGVEEVADWLQGRSGGVNDQYRALLKQANWYWAPGEAELPGSRPRFWNLETLWAAKVLYAALFALGGVVLVGAIAFLLEWPFWIAIVAGGITGLVGFFDPDTELREAAERRRRQIILEMGYKVPELRAYVRSGRTFVSALRYLTSRPGGPFVKELYRVLRIYDITTDLERGLAAAKERNATCESMVNLCGDLMAAIAEGGEVGKVLETHAEAAQHEQQRMLRQQGQDNTQQMSYVVTATTLIVVFLLIGAPALWNVVVSLAGS